MAILSSIAMAQGKRKAGPHKDSTLPEKKQKISGSSSGPMLLQEEPSFPRGGASILTPLEQKQIQIQAKNDVLFEQSTGKKASLTEFDDQENEIREPEEIAEAPGKSNKRSKAKGRKSKAAHEEKEYGVRIEGLSYKRLAPGSLVLGQVSQINRYDIALCLPNNLTGYVPLTSISDILTKEVEARAEQDEEEEGDGSNGNELSLGCYFTIGQYLRVYVVSTETEPSPGSPKKKHIELSLDPRKVNSGLNKEGIIVNSTLQATVKSVEDHGLVMDIGLSDENVHGFMSSKGLGYGTDTSTVKEGAVYLCLVTGLTSSGNIIKLSADLQKAGNIKKGNFLTIVPIIDSFLPGCAVEILVSEVTESGIIGKAIGVLDLTADFIHSGSAASGKDIEQKYTSGSKIKARIICTFPTAEQKKLGISLLQHVLSFDAWPTSSTPHAERKAPLEVLPISTILQEARVVKVQPGAGLFVDVGVKGVRGYVHISRISDSKVESLEQNTGLYKVGSTHEARIIGYNSIDGLYIVSLEPKVIAQPFLRVDDVQVGQLVKGTVGKLLINESGVSGMIVHLAEGVSGLVPEVHFADIHLQHPEKKFKEGSAVTARVLSTFPSKRQIRLTLKKALVHSDGEFWTSYDGLKPGSEAAGTIVNILPSGAVVQFYGPIRGFLPVSEMSESYIEDAKQHFRKGQVVKVHILSVDPEEKRMTVSCKDALLSDPTHQEELEKLVVGSKVTGTVLEKTADQLILELSGSRLKAVLPFEHLTDGSALKSSSTGKRLRVGQTMKELIVLVKEEGKQLVRLSSKPSLLREASEKRLLKEISDVIEGAEVHGYVNNTTPSGVFVRFGSNLTGLLPKKQLPEEAAILPDYGMRRDQSISCRILAIDQAQQRFLLTAKPASSTAPPDAQANTTTSSSSNGKLINPVDEVSTSINDFTLGKLTKARVKSVKDTQLNVELADGVQGRIDASEIFDKIGDIKNRKQPLKAFHSKQVLAVRIMGMHDSRTHRFLPITHQVKAPVFELSAKPSNQTADVEHILTLDKVRVGSTHLVFVNNFAEDCIWVSLSPNVRGRIKSIDVSDDLSLLQDIAKNFPVGSVLKARVLKADVQNGRLDLSARSGHYSNPLTLNDLSVGMVLPGRVTKVNERYIMVQLNEFLSGPVNLTDIADDYSEANPTIYEKNQIIRVYVKQIDAPNTKITLSTRPSKVLSSTLPVEDREITSLSDLKVNDLVRGFVKNIADEGLFVSLGSNITSYIRVSDLSDSFIKDWKSTFEVDQLVKGKIIDVDPLLKHVQMSLKQSHVDKDYKPPLKFNDMHVGQIVTGKVRKVEEYGVFVVVDDSANVSGLCHRSQMADGRMKDPKKLFEEGDLVKAKVLKIDQEKKRISFGLKASYFNSEADPGNNRDDEEHSKKKLPNGRSVIEDDNISENSEVARSKEMIAPNISDEELDVRQVEDHNRDVDMEAEHAGGVSIEADVSDITNLPALNAGGFDWTGGLSQAIDDDSHSDYDIEATEPKKKKRRKAEIKIDRTGELDAYGPQSVADYERLLMGQPNSSVLWLSYMAFQLQLNDVEKAREIAERALKMIHIREDGEKLNVWVAMLNLENTYGTEESLEEVFKRACQYNDSLEIHERLISIHIQSGNNEVS